MMLRILKKRAAKKMPVMALLAVMAAVMAMPANTVYAASQATVTWKNVSQGIDSAGRYVYDGSKTDPTMSGLVLKQLDSGSPGKWGYVNKGAVQRVSGLYPNYNGWWKVENGWVNFDVNTIAKVADGEWYSFTGGKRQFKNNRTVMKNTNGWWYLVDGKVDFDYDGFAQNDMGVWWIDGGRVTFNTNDILKDSTAAIDNTGSWYYVVGSKVDFTHTGVDKNANGWWRVENGKVNFNFNGAASNNKGTWYIRGGKVDFSFTGSAYGYYFVGGKAQ